MENTMFGGQTTSPAYDFRVYDRVWQRVAPGTDPFSADPAAAGMTDAAQDAPAPAAETPAVSVSAASSSVPAPVQENGGAAVLPGADPNPCCMGTEARESLGVLEGFMQEESAESRCCQALSCRIQNPQAARLLRRAAQEKRAAVRELCAAYFLITGERYHPAVTLEQICWDSLPQALRAFYHQEACNGLNYERAADEAMDICLKKLLARLSQQAYRRAEDLLALLGRVVCC